MGRRSGGEAITKQDSELGEKHDFTPCDKSDDDRQASKLPRMIGERMEEGK